MTAEDNLESCCLCLPSAGIIGVYHLSRQAGFVVVLLRIMTFQVYACYMEYIKTACHFKVGKHSIPYRKISAAISCSFICLFMVTWIVSIERTTAVHTAVTAPTRILLFISFLYTEG